MTSDVMADDTVAYLDGMVGGPAHLVGWSDEAAAALLVAQPGVEPPPPEPSSACGPATLLLLVPTGGVAVHLLLPQVGELRQTLAALRLARWARLAVGMVLTAASYLAAAVAQLGAVDPRLPWGAPRSE